MKHLYDSLRACAKEVEVKAEFCKMSVYALGYLNPDRECFA